MGGRSPILVAPSAVDSQRSARRYGRLARNRRHSLASYKRSSASNQPGNGFRRLLSGGNDRARTNGRASASYSGDPTPDSRCGEAGGPIRQSSRHPSGRNDGAHRCRIRFPHAGIPVLPPLPVYGLPSGFRKPGRPAKCNRAFLTCPAESQAIVSLEGFRTEAMGAPMAFPKKRPAVAMSPS
jgi:hypothetical protein